MNWLTFQPTTAAWILLAAAGLLEIAWATGMKATDGFTRPLISAAVLVLALLSFWLLALAMRTLPAGTAYAVWVGIGAAGTALLGIAIHGEPATLGRLACIGLIVAGVLGLALMQD